MRPLEIHPDAAVETSEAAQYYKDIDPALSSRFQAGVFAAIEKICSQPFLFRRFDGDFRKARVDRFPYAVVFHMSGTDTIQIVAIAHLHREPGYWRDRTA